jgi:hypothetical protein
MTDYLKAAATKLPVFSIYGTVADDIVTRCEPTTAIAIDLLHTPKNLPLPRTPLAQGRVRSPQRPRC